MNKKEQIKFKKNESFYIRDGWFEKAINTISDNTNVNIFAKYNGIIYLGIGSNMVKSLKYRLRAANLIESTNSFTNLTKFGGLCKKWDPYFESSFVWFLIHYFLATNYIECPIFNVYFNSQLKTIKKDELVDFLQNKFKSDGFEVKNEYVEDDLNVFLKTYCNEAEASNPEDNYTCPLSKLAIIRKKGDKIEKTNPKFSSLNYLVIYFSLANIYQYNSFNIEDSFFIQNSPFLIFNLDKNTYLQYLDQMQKNSLITINKTAGLNVVYFNKKLDLEKIFETYFGSNV